jgi:dUTP pyrophosphatase
MPSRRSCRPCPVRLDPGELEVLLLNTDREEACELRAGDRIAQLVVDPCAPAEPVELELVSQEARDSGGFGSSGV